MLKNVKNILVGTTAEALEHETSSALSFAVTLAQEAEARLTVQAASVKLVFSHAMLGGFAARLVATENARLRSEATKAAENTQRLANLSGISCTTENLDLPYNELVPAFIAQTRAHDLTILDAEPETFSLDRGLINAALFRSGRPLIIVPAGCEFRGNRIMVAWDGGAEATRAVNDALPFLRAAHYVEIVSVVGEKDLTHSDPGAELAPHLAAHGVEVTVVDLVMSPDGVGDTLRQRAASAHIDMVVMGAFAHSWIQRIVFGGATQSLLQASPVPLFLSR